MKNKLTFRMWIILVITVIAVAAGVYSTVSVLFYNAMVEDIQERAIGVKDYILKSLTYADFEDIGKDSETGVLANQHAQEILHQLQGVGNLKSLYLAKKDETGAIITTMGKLSLKDDIDGYTPTGELDADLRRSLTEGVAVVGRNIYQTEHGSLYTMFWPVLDENYQPMGAVCMEFDVHTIYEFRRRAAVYSLGLSAALIILISFVAYLSMSKVSEPFYKKLAYTDFLTGLENRMAFEQRLRECGPIADQGKRVTLLIFDVNNLKVANDTLGHDKGDLYLKNTADVLYQNFHKLATLYRIGGDEFAGIAVNAKENQLEAAVKAISSEKKMMLKDYPFSCACGVASFTMGVDQSLRDVFKRADEAMYTDKKRQKGLL